MMKNDAAVVFDNAAADVMAVDDDDDRAMAVKDMVLAAEKALVLQEGKVEDLDPLLHGPSKGIARSRVLEETVKAANVQAEQIL
jgi:hypothetical protein